MHQNKLIIVFLFLGLFAWTGLSVRLKAQNSGRGDASQGSRIPPDILRTMQKKANQQRQEQLKRDTERLVKLSTELKEYVDKTNENVLSLDVIKKAEEIEKLARSVKTKMRGEQYGSVELP